MAAIMVVAGIIVGTAEFEFDAEDVEDSDRSEDAVDPPADESPTSTDDVPDDELSREDAVLGELSVRDEDEASAPLVKELEEMFEFAPAGSLFDPVAVLMALEVDSVVADPKVSDPVGPAAPFDVMVTIPDTLVDAPVVATPDASVVAGPDAVDVAAPVGAVPDAFAVADPVGALVAEPVVVAPSAGPDEGELDEVAEPGQTITSPLHIWPLEQSLNVY